MSFTLNSGVRTTAPALPNSKAVRSWGNTLCLQKSSGKESRFSLRSWKNCCFSAGSLIYINTHTHNTDLNIYLQFKGINENT